MSLRQNGIPSRAIRILQIAGGIVAAVIVVAFTVVQLRLTRPSSLSAQEALLTQQNEALLKLVASAEEGTLLDFKDILIVVDQALVQDLLRAVTPMDAEVGNGFHVRIESADAEFGDGVALVRMTGTARVDDSEVGAKVTVLGAIDAVRIDPESGLLRAGISIVGVEADGAEALGGSNSVGRLTEALAHGGLSLLLDGLEIPVRVENHLHIPAVASRRLQIVADDLPLTVAAQQIKVFKGKLWVFVSASLVPRSEVSKEGE